ncbi:hypothetical protein BGZ61DRAFT_433541 [Ilyonectria robusta]|uniref:uncharacterized protein n=1 Tax=Ilyonectria robusta TaxID=1079257 RepID=UPI001E8D2F46|nr:uncharacterized protein BGZ61DRAFT_433541 [Ilyonectria robusta]KAH8659437.1 hypothetical protein BGZ61DRAFT_433541 [Ilyonectria robusta]
MEAPTPQYWYRECPVQTAWSSDVIVVEVLMTFTTPNWTFHGIRAANYDWEQWDWPRSDGLLWVVDDGQRLRLWQDFRQCPNVMQCDSECSVEAVIGYYQSDTGNNYVAVKWQDYECPTWELESDLAEDCF